MGGPPSRVTAAGGDTPGEWDLPDSLVTLTGMPPHDDPHAAPLPSGAPHVDSRSALQPDEIAMLDESLRLLGSRTDRMVGYFYAAIFLEAPELRSLFPAAMDQQRDRFFRTIRYLPPGEPGYRLSVIRLAITRPPSSGPRTIP